MISIGGYLVLFTHVARRSTYPLLSSRGFLASENLCKHYGQTKKRRDLVKFKSLFVRLLSENEK